jgi:DNA-binding MarR family transcriptional regulator
MRVVDARMAEETGVADQTSTATQRGDVAAVADAFTVLVRGAGRARAQFLSEARERVDWTANLLISALAIDGPMRSSALAEIVQSDPSTVSRQVQALVKEGFVERQADPEDGRASVLVLTARGEQVYRDHRRLRDEQYQRILADWTPDELRTFASQLARFTTCIQGYRPGWVRASAQPGTGGTSSAGARGTGDASSAGARGTGDASSEDS